MPSNISNDNSDRLQKRYDTLYRGRDGGLRTYTIDRWPKNRMEALVYFFPEKAGRVLEIGCGNGSVLHNLAGQCEHLTGIELSSVRVDAAKRNLRHHQNIEILQANIEDGLNKPDRYYDIVMWADVIEHVVDIFAAMDEIKRLLNDNGKLVTITPNFLSLKRRLKMLIGQFPNTSVAENSGLDVRDGEMFDGGHVHYFSYPLLKKLYRKYDIEPLESLGFGKMGRLHNILPNLLSNTTMLVGQKKKE